MTKLFDNNIATKAARKRSLFLPSLTLVSSLFTASMSLAEGEGRLGNWQVSGSNTVSAETYGSSAKTSGTEGSPYPFEGGQFSDQISISADQSSAAQRNSLQLDVLLNDSEYLAADNGVVPQRLSFIHENGGVALPYRLHVGDFFGYFSQLSIQRSLKGVQLEAQPRVIGNTSHSLILMAGENDPDWRGLALGEDSFFGASWLAQQERGALWGMNIVRNNRDADLKQGVVAISQQVVTLAYNNDWLTDSQDFSLEVEVASFSGDTSGAIAAGAAKDRSGGAIAVDMIGKLTGLPFDYRARLEQFDRDYQPRGAVVSTGRRSAELYGTWRLLNGLRLEGRSLNYHDGFETDVGTRTRSQGVNLSGSTNGLFGARANSSIDTFRQEVSSDGGGTDNESWVINASFSQAINDNWFGRASYYHQRFQDRSLADLDSRLDQVSFSADHPMNLGTWQGAISTGVQLRQIDGVGSSTEWNPTVAMHLAEGRHSFAVNMGYLRQQRDAASLPDSRIQTANIEYEYGIGRHTFGLEAAWYDNEQIALASTDTDAYKVGVYWRTIIDNDLLGELNQVNSAELSHDSVSTFGIAGLSLYQDFDTALRTLASQGLEGGVDIGIYRVIEFPLLANVNQRQRVVLEQHAGLLKSVSVIIDFDQRGGAINPERVYQEVRQQLLQKFGAPSYSLAEGDFANSYQQDINNGNLQRVDEWRMAKGKMRFGLPTRLDGTVRMEIQQRFNFEPAQNRRWSLRDIR